MADKENEEKTEKDTGLPKFKLKIDPKPDKSGNPIISNEGPMISGDSTKKKFIEEGDDE